VQQQLSGQTNFWTNCPEIHSSVSTTSGDPWYQYLKIVQKFNKQVRCGMRPIRHRDLSMYNNCFLENWYQQSRDWDFPLIVQFFDFVKGFKGRSSGRKVQDPVLSFFQNSNRISWEISGFDINYIFCSLRFLVISHRF